MREEIHANGLQMETSSQEQLTAFGLFQNSMPNWRQHIGMTIFRNQIVPKKILIPSKYLQLRNEEVSVENVG